MVASDGRKLLPIPSGDVSVANAFAIHQIGSDDKNQFRCGNNATVEVDDAPNHQSSSTTLRQGGGNKFDDTDFYC